MVLEIKCPFPLSNKHPKAVDDMKTDENNNIYKISADYSQVQGQIGILEMKICGRVFLHSKGY